MPRVDLLSDAERTSAGEIGVAESGRVARGRRRRRRTRVALVAGTLGAAVVLTGAVAVASMVTEGDSADAQGKAPSPAVASASPSVSPSPSPSVSPSPSPSPSRSPKPRATTRSPKPVPVHPTATVVVYNNTQIRGLAARSADRVRNVGFAVRAVGNLYGEVDRTTVFYRPGSLAQANLLAERLRGLQAVRPAPAWLPGNAAVTLVVKADFAD
jgi:hypothetical protein